MDAAEITISVIEAVKPKFLSKRFELDKNGTLQKQSVGKLAEGVCTKLKLGFGDFVQALKTLEPKHALLYGANGHDRALIVPLRDAGKTTSDLPVVARTREIFSWPDGPAIFFNDCDSTSKGRLPTKEELRAALCGVWPELRRHPHVLIPSASSHIYRVSDGVELRGLGGWHLLTPVQDGRDIPRAGNILHQRLFLAGYGRYEVSKSGALLERGILDPSVWQPERLDFAGGASCGPGLEQRRPTPEVFNPDAPFIDTKTLVDLDLSEMQRLKALKAEMRVSLKAEVEDARKKWIEERLNIALANVPEKDRPKERDRLEDIFRRAVEERRLLAGFELISEKFGPVTVGEVLDNPEKFHNTRFADPLEPEYDRKHRIAWVNLRVAGTPYIFSHAHGGVRYRLHRALETIQIQPGELHHLVDKCLSVMKLDGVVYQRGNELIRKAGRQLIPVTPDWLTVYLTRLLRFLKFDARSNGWTPSDCAARHAKSICSVQGEWNLLYLKALLTSPSITPAGRIIHKDGYDLDAQVYLEFPDGNSWKSIPDNIGRDQVRHAVGNLWFPFKEFPFVGPVDRGVFLSAIFTAITRPLNPTAPGFLLGSPCAGSGKTISAKCLSILAGCDVPAVLPRSDNDEELRKRLFALARNGAPVVVLDNVSGSLESDSLCAYLTAERITDRVLGVSDMGEAPCNALLLITGNNVSLVGDLNRRVLRCTIDPGMEKPYQRRFELNPEVYVKANRLKLIHAAVTILSAFRNSSPTAPCDSLASFEIWSDFIRQCVIWVGAQGWLDVGDPAEAITASYDDDPDTNKLRSLLHAWDGSFGKSGGTVPEAIKLAEGCTGTDGLEQDERLFESLDEIAGERGKINPRRLGRWIEQRVGRIVDGMKFVRGSKRKDRVVWSVWSVSTVCLKQHGKVSEVTNNIDGLKQTGETVQTDRFTSRPQSSPKIFNEPESASLWEVEI